MIKRKNQRGQIAVLAALSILSLAMLWMMAINIGKIISDRIMMQNAADNAAYSAATLRAQALNQLGASNNSFIPLLIFSDLAASIGVDGFKVSWLPYMDANSTYMTYQGVSMALDALKIASEVFIFQRTLDVAQNNGADYIIPTALLNPSNPLEAFSLGVERKNEDVWFCDTLVVYGIPIPVPTRKERVKTWFYIRENQPAKNIITAVKNYGTGFFPVGKQFFGINRMPGIYTVAAAKPYNPDSSMFPLESDKMVSGILGKYSVNKKWKAQLVPIGSIYQH